MMGRCITALAALCTVCNLVLAAPYDVKKEEHYMNSFDGLYLSGVSFESVPRQSNETFPLVIFPNSWAVPINLEYVRVQKLLAGAGYVAFAYQTRGWYKSGGEIDVAGPLDLADANMVVDYCLRTFPNVDPDNIAFVGISYGGGIGLLAAANDSRVTAVVSMSGWMSMLHSLDWQWSPSLVWGNILNALGDVFGRPRPDLKELLHDLFSYTNVQYFTDWSAKRSVDSHTSILEQRQIPVFIANGMEDNLFHSCNELDWWRQYKGPKKLMLSQGTHAEAEAPYLIAPNLSTVWGPIWKDTFDFLDYHLKKIDNGVMSEGLVKMQLQSALTLDEYLSFDAPVWPPVKGYVPHTYTFGERSTDAQFGTLVRKLFGAEVLHPLHSGQAPSSSATIQYTKATKMACGIPVATAGLEPFVPFRLNLTTIDPNYELLFRSPPMLTNTRVCGSIRIEGLMVQSSTDRFQVYGYVYHEPPALVPLEAVLLGHTARTVWVNATAGVSHRLPSLDFRVTCRDVPIGHRLVVGFNLHNELYGQASTSAAVTFFQDNKATVTIPIVEKQQ